MAISEFEAAVVKRLDQMVSALQSINQQLMSINQKTK